MLGRRVFRVLRDDVVRQKAVEEYEIARAIEGVEPPEAFFDGRRRAALPDPSPDDDEPVQGLLHLLMEFRLVLPGGPIPIARRQSRGEAIESARHLQGVEDGENDGLFELHEIRHGRSAVEADADVLVFEVPGVTAGAGQADQSGGLCARRGIAARFHAGKADRQAIAVVGIAEDPVTLDLGGGIRRQALREGWARNETIALKVGGIGEASWRSERRELRTLELQEPVVGHRQRRRSLRGVVEPEAFAIGPGLIEPVSLPDLAGFRQRGWQKARDRRPLAASFFKHRFGRLRGKDDNGDGDNGQPDRGCETPPDQTPKYHRSPDRLSADSDSSSSGRRKIRRSTARDRTGWAKGTSSPRGRPKGPRVDRPYWR